MRKNHSKIVCIKLVHLPYQVNTLEKMPRVPRYLQQIQH